MLCLILKVKKIVEFYLPLSVRSDWPVNSILKVNFVYIITNLYSKELKVNLNKKTYLFTLKERSNKITHKAAIYFLVSKK